MKIQAMPFVPGQVRGTLCHDATATGSEPAILLLHYDDLLHVEQMPAGLVVVGGAPLSHPMTQLQSLGLPTVIVSERQAAELRAGMQVFLDGYAGTIQLATGEQAVAAPPQVALSPGEPTETADGTGVELRASITGEAGAADARRVGATAVGMVRTEYLTPPHGRMPDVSYYLKAFRAICEAAAPLPVTFRLLDISVDKKPPWLGQMQGMTGLLGLQGSRLFGIRPVSTVLQAQLAALETVSRDYELRVLMPYVASPEEFRHWRNRVRAWLPDRVEIAAMAETPAAALAMPEWRRGNTRVSLGCNDLMQCLFGADRDIPEVAGYLDPYSPSLFRFLSLVANSAEAHLENVQLCGLLQQMPGVLSILLGLGYRNFSTSTRLIPALAQVVHRTRIAEAEQLAAAVLEASDSGTVRDLLGLPTESRPVTPWLGNA